MNESIKESKRYREQETMRAYQFVGEALCAAFQPEVPFVPPLTFGFGIPDERPALLCRF